MRSLSVIALLVLLVACDTLTKTAEYALNRYKVSTPSMTPTLPVGMTFSVLSADSFNVNQIVAFFPPVSKIFPGIDTTSVWVSRLVGAPNDELQMKRGELFRNGEPYPFAVKVKHSYRVTTSMPLNEKRMESYEYGLIETDVYQFYLSTDELPDLRTNKAIIKVESMILNEGEAGYYGDKIFFDGNRDNWGPITVPANTYFILGDSRHNALDSRYLGFIPAENIKGYAAVEDSK